MGGKVDLHVQGPEVSPTKSYMGEGLVGFVRNRSFHFSFDAVLQVSVLLMHLWK